MINRWSARWLRDFCALAEKQGWAHQARALYSGGKARRLVASGGGVEVSVQGSQPEPFVARMWFKALDAADRRRLEGRDVRALLAAGDEATALLLLPPVTGASTWSCTCPYRGEGPCTHLLVAGYALVEWWDADPTRLLDLRAVGGAGGAGRAGGAGMAGGAGGVGGAGSGPAGSEPATTDVAQWLWGEVPDGPAVPYPREAAVRDLLSEPVAKRMANAAGDANEYSSLLSDLGDFYKAFLSYEFPSMRP